MTNISLKSKKNPFSFLKKQIQDLKNLLIFKNMAKSNIQEVSIIKHNGDVTSQDNKEYKMARYYFRFSYVFSKTKNIDKSNSLLII